MFERFTDAARRVLVLAQEEARRLNHGFIGTEHILLGLMAEGEGVAARVLAELDISLEPVRRLVQETIGLSGSRPTRSPPFTPRAKKVLELSWREALGLGHNHIGTEHILLGLLRQGEGVGAQVLLGLGADPAQVSALVIRFVGGHGGPSPDDPAPASARAGVVRTLGHGPSGDPACSFCGRRGAETGRLVAGPMRSSASTASGSGRVVWPSRARRAVTRVS